MTVYAPPKVRSPLFRPDQNKVRSEAVFVEAVVISGEFEIVAHSCQAKICKVYQKSGCENQCQSLLFPLCKCIDQSSYKKSDQKIDFEQLSKPCQ